jgi:AcrR family transcriptional regulator
MEPAATLTRRDRKKQATRDAIIEAALDLFEQQGFTATTIDEISERADVAQRTFFRYFETKEAVLLPDADRRGALFSASLNSQPTDQPILTRILAAVVDASADRSDDTRVARRQSAILEKTRGIGDNITWASLAAGHKIMSAAVAEALDAPPTDERVLLITNTAQLLTTRAMRTAYATPGKVDLAEILDQKLIALRELVTEA